MTNKTIVFVLSVSAFFGGQSFLLAESKVSEIVFEELPSVKVLVANPVQVLRDSETVSLSWNEIQKIEPNLTKDNVAVYEIKTKRFFVTQIVEDDDKTELLFQTNLAPGEKNILGL